MQLNSLEKNVRMRNRLLAATLASSATATASAGAAAAETKRRRPAFVAQKRSDCQPRHTRNGLARRIIQ
ncbi:GM12022 [Drosophila sechellia]|uniref:GM12022 n=1 Tax=Drosophila sechellia TaxID=7238 RepID=B4IJ76_DROSE|nr:GM12022 [Drosophila sechellia]